MAPQDQTKGWNQSAESCSSRSLGHPFTSTRRHAKAERWVRSARTECLDHVFILRSSRYLCLEAFITFISEPHDDGTPLILAPYRGAGERFLDHDTPSAPRTRWLDPE